MAATLGGVGARVSGAFVAFLVGLELARAMGPTEYGSYGTVVAVTTMLTVLAQLGMPQLATRNISVSVAEGALDEAKGTLIWFTASVFGASVLIAVTSAAIGIGWASDPNPFPMRAYYWGLASIPLLALRNLGVGLRLHCNVYDTSPRRLQREGKAVDRVLGGIVLVYLNERGPGRDIPST